MRMGKSELGYLFIDVGRKVLGGCLPRPLPHWRNLTFHITSVCHFFAFKQVFANKTWKNCAKRDRCSIICSKKRLQSRGVRGRQLIDDGAYLLSVTALLMGPMGSHQWLQRRISEYPVDAWPYKSFVCRRWAVWGLRVGIAINLWLLVYSFSFRRLYTVWTGITIRSASTTERMSWNRRSVRQWFLFCVGWKCSLTEF